MRPGLSILDWPAGSREEGREFRPVANLAPLRPSGEPLQYAGYSAGQGVLQSERSVRP